MTNDRPDFVKIYKAFYDETRLSNGDRAEIKKAANPSDLETLPAFYKLLGNRLNQTTEKQWQRVVFFLVKGLKHKASGSSLGKVLKNSDKIREQRIFQVIRSQSPNDLIQLRRLVIHVQPTIDFQTFAKQIWFWGKNSKKRLLKDFLLEEESNKKPYEQNKNKQTKRKGENNE